MDNFYKAFEDKFRGSRELIKSRLDFYLPFVDALEHNSNMLHALDLGCGRGEWIELISKFNIRAVGVDLDEGMLKFCRSINLNVIYSDAIEYLKQCKDESYDIISGFHIAEHIPFDNLRLLVLEAKRILKKGGILILETPNPENISVATNSFYLDPTHNRPLPPDLLAFLPEYYGFNSSNIMRLNNFSDLSDNINIKDVIYGASPDYSIIAQKHGNEERIIRFQSLLNKEYGVSLNKITNDYDINMNKKFELFNSDIINIIKQNVEYKNTLIQKEKEIKILNTKLSDANESVQQKNNELISLLNSKSWRITKPLRLTSSRLKPLIKNTARPVLKFSMNFIQKNPKLKQYLNKCLRLFPKLENRIKLFTSFYSKDISYSIHKTNNQDNIIDIHDLSPYADEIYNKIKLSIKNQKKGK
ncbi:MAG: hypothetical protein RLZZ210_1752 [Pseudomonadota bacterium]